MLSLSYIISFSLFLSLGQLAAGTCEIVTLDRDSSQPRRTIARQTARCACKKGQIAGTTRARPACVDGKNQDPPRSFTFRENPRSMGVEGLKELSSRASWATTPCASKTISDVVVSPLSLLRWFRHLEWSVALHFITCCPCPACHLGRIGKQLLDTHRIASLCGVALCLYYFLCFSGYTWMFYQVEIPSLPLHNTYKGY